MTTNLLEVPRTLPVAHLSHSSVKLYLTCPEKWRRKYLEMEYEVTNSNLLIGKTVGSGASAGYVEKLKGAEEIGTVMLDVASDTFDDVVQHEEVDWQETTVGAAKDVALACVGAYHDRVAKLFEPTTVEEGFSIQLPEADWDIQGHIDITGSGPGLAAELHDIKTVSKASNDLDTDPQATLYVASRYVRDGSLPIFAHHQIKKPNTRNPAEVRLLTTERTQVQVNNYLARIAQVAREIDWRFTSGDWQGAAPGSWMCSQKYCGYFSECAFGGAR